MIKKFIILIFIFTVFQIFSSSKSRQEIVSELFKSIEGWFGVPYVLGGQTKNGIDCSGFVREVYKDVFNLDLPRTVTGQKVLGDPVNGALQPGDLVFFDTIGGGVSHVGIYVFDNKFIHAASAGPSVGVIKSSLNEKYYKERFLFARRLVKLPQFIKDNNKIELSENKEIEKDKKIEVNRRYIIFYKFLTNGKLIDKSLVFKKNSPIFYKIQNTNEEKDIVLIFENKETKESKNIDLNYIDSMAIQSIKLDSGNYIVKFVKDKNVIYKKEIIVI
ncbi:MAG TPA: NlpC/P60 family protein [Spirochaetota bacterium]|nr:NlpC/P60 family protein [Spirochaetota bacterium]